jgi:hypothetical protein
VSCLARKVTNEVSVSRRRRSPSARSTLLLKASLAQFYNLWPLCDELEPEAVVSAWTEAESARIEASSAREHVASKAEEVQQQRLELGQVIRERDQPQSHAVEAMSRAEVLGGQLAEATKRPAEASARTGALVESLAVRAQARWWRPPSRWRSFHPCRRPRPGQIPPRVEMTPRALLLPLPMSEPAGTVCLKHAYVFHGR